MATEILARRADSPDAVALIEELDAALAPLYAIESRHGFSVAKLIADGVAFFVATHDGKPAGCGGLLIVGTEYAEVKRMYVRPAFRGLGIARRLLAHLEEQARMAGLSVVRLETGIHQREAIGLYEQAGFVRIAPFGPYSTDPVSLCYEKRLDQGE
jgi:ribosomal protein S18 acetylase RimI-like enzyme